MKLRRSKGCRCRPRCRGFTLIELLVVISIIALLVSLLLPSMSGARRMGQRAACAAALRDIAKGMIEYATDNDEWIVGSPYGSGNYLRGAKQAWGPAVQTWDFMGPLAAQWGFGLTLPSVGDDVGEVAKRFNQLRNHPAFLCAGNKFLALNFRGPDAGAGWMVSYNTNRYQLLPARHGWWGHEEKAPGSWPPPAAPSKSSWRPAVDKMGVPADKIFCGDGARYSSCTEVPDYDLLVDSTYGGTFADSEPFAGKKSGANSQSWDRRRAPGNPAPYGPRATDGRVYAYRHSTGIPPIGAPGNAYRANFAFYDGHVESQGDLESSSPWQWLPDGSTLLNSNTLPDVMARFGINQNETVIGHRWDM
jgi:prepilin-type N-terminal cleavage/methylation domain-containing protein/prepilin-type processing-associated H-X9-DG protein